MAFHIKNMNDKLEDWMIPIETNQRGIYSLSRFDSSMDFDELRKLNLNGFILIGDEYREPTPAELDFYSQNRPGKPLGVFVFWFKKVSLK